MSSSTNSKADAPKQLQDRWKIQNLMRLTEAENWDAMHEEQQKNREAESAWTRKNLWGAEEVANESEDMRQTILGDVNHPAPIVVAPSNSGGLAQTLLPVLLGASLMGVPAAGIAGAALMSSFNQPAVTQPAEQTDETVSIGLGKIEDYLKESK